MVQQSGTDYPVLEQTGPGQANSATLSRGAWCVPLVRRSRGKSRKLVGIRRHSCRRTIQAIRTLAPRGEEESRHHVETPGSVPAGGGGTLL